MADNDNPTVQTRGSRQRERSRSQYQKIVEAVEALHMDAELVMGASAHRNPLPMDALARMVTQGERLKSLTQILPPSPRG
jgi:hypothetical protein